MVDSNAEFNLIDEPWVSVVYLNGEAKDVSLRTLFLDAPQIGQISGDFSQQTAPILRLALAVLYRAYFYEDEEYDDVGKEQEWVNIWCQGHFDMDEIDEYFDFYHDRFNLLDPQYPFFQVPKLTYQSGKEYDPVGEIIADVPKPEKFLFSLRSKNTVDDLSLAEAARWLVYLQAYDPAGIKTPVEGNTHVNKGRVYPPKGVVGTGWMGAIGSVFLEGSTLFTTLLFNWCLVSDRSKGESLAVSGNDKPAWEKDVPGFDLDVTNGPAGPADLFTWQDRRIRLVTNESNNRVVGIVSCYGDVFTGYNRQAFETMTAWRESSAQQKKLGSPVPPLMPITLDSSKALWQGLEPLLMKSMTADNDFRPEVIRWMERMEDKLADQGISIPGVTIHAQGISYGTQSSVVEDSIDDSLNISALLLRHDAPAVARVVDVVSATEQAVFQLVQLARRVEQAAGDKRGKDQVTVASNDVREFAYGELDALFRQRIANFGEDEDPREYAEDWKHEVYLILLRLGSQYIANSSGSAFLVREIGEKKPAISVARADLMFRSGLNKYLGTL